MKTKTKSKKASSRTNRTVRSEGGRDAASNHRRPAASGNIEHRNFPKTKPQEQMV